MAEPVFQIQIVCDGVVVDTVGCGDYHLILYQGGLIMHHKDSLMVDKLSAIGMAGKVVERVGMYAEAMKAPKWWVSFIYFQANLLMLTVEYIERMWGVLPVRLSTDEYDKMLHVCFESAGKTRPTEGAELD